MELSLRANSSNCTFEIAADVGLAQFQLLIPSLMVMSALATCLSGFHSVYLLFKRRDTVFLGNASYYSLAILIAIHFNFFGIFVNMAISITEEYLQLLSMAAVCCLMTSITLYKLTYVMLVSRHSDHPHLMLNNCRSPKFRFCSIYMVFQLISYIGFYYILRYPVFSYFIIPYYCYPFIHILNAFVEGKRNSFRWYI